MIRPWRLLVWSPMTAYANQTEANAKAVYTNTSPGGLVGGFNWSLERSGNCKQLTFTGSPMSHNGVRRLNIGRRDIIRLQVDLEEISVFVNMFAGVIVENPPARETRESPYLALGPKELFRLRSLDVRRIAVVQPVTEFVDDISDLFPAQVSYSTPSSVGVGNLNLFEAPGVRLTQALDSLKQAVTGFEWGVDRNAIFFFRAPTNSVTFSYGTSGLRWLPIKSEEIATKVNILAVAENKGTPSELFVQADTNSLLEPRDAEYAPVIDTVSFEHAEHANLGAERTYVSPIPTLKVIRPTYVTVNNFTNGANATDADKSTYASNNAGPASITLENGTSEKLRGFTLRYRVLDGTYPVKASIEHGGFGFTFPPVARATFQLRKTTEIQTLEVVFLPSSGLGSQDSTWIKVELDSTADAFRVYDFKTYALDSTALAEVAESLVRLPASEPAELSRPGFVEPAATVTVTGAPGGDVSGDAERWHYSLSPDEGLWTRVSLGQRSEDEAVRALRLQAEEFAETAASALRVYARGSQ
jgi:hypothetical protein